ncbi:MAG: M20/M25/M40 family metallo-hydrolase [Anaerovorax sp.]|nr:M20/M25/M40 family metallo-hydrolase [Anaerovorax sp.]
MDRITERYHQMIRIKSVNGNERELAEYIAGILENIGLEVHWSYFEEDKEKKERPSIYATMKSGKPGKTLMLIGHLDTVKVASGWDTNPFEPAVVGDRTYGLGAMDMKGGLAAILETLEYFKEHSDEFTGNILAAFVADEEDLSKGTYQLVQEGLQADAAIMAECRYDNVAIGFRGRYSIEVSVFGKAAHACRYPEVGENALISGGKLAEAIEKLPTLTHPNLKHGTWCVRHIEGGVKNALIVPERCDLFVDRYVVPGEDFETCKKQILEAAEKLGLTDKVEVRLKPRKSPYMQSFSLEPDDEIVLALKEAYAEVTGNEVPHEYDPSVCDSNILAVLLGIPTITFGPSGSNMHGANEYGHIDQVKSCIRIYTSFAKKILR